MTDRTMLIRVAANIADVQAALAKARASIETAGAAARLALQGAHVAEIEEAFHLLTAQVHFSHARRNLTE